MRRHVLHPALLLGTAILPAACGGASASEPDASVDAGPAGSAELVMGSAMYSGESFVAVDDGAEVELIPGAQGGFHVWINVRIRGAQGNLYLQRDARRVRDGELVSRGLPYLIEVPAEALEHAWESPYAAPAFMCPAPLGLNIIDEELVFTATLSNAEDQVLATDELVLIPRCPSGDQEEFCRRICAG